MVHFKLKFKYSFNNNVTLKQHLLLEIYDILMDGCLLWLERIVARSLGVITFIYNISCSIHSFSHFKFVLYNLGGKKREGNTSNTNWQFITRLNFMRLWISKRRNKFLFLYLYDKMLISRFQLF